MSSSQPYVIERYEVSRRAYVIERCEVSRRAYELYIEHHEALDRIFSSTDQGWNNAWKFCEAQAKAELDDQPDGFKSEEGDNVPPDERPVPDVRLPRHDEVD